MTGVAEREDAPTRLEEVRVADVMSARVLSLPRTAALSDVARLMASERIHCVVIADGPHRDGKPLWGILSALDLVAAATVRGLEEQTAGPSAASEVVTVEADETLLRAGQLMTEHAVPHLVVVDPESGAPVGVLSTLDVTAALAHAVGEEEACSASP
jgi:CBS domain-containing protein